MRSKKKPQEEATYESAWKLIQENARAIKAMQKENAISIKAMQKENAISIKAMQKQIGGIANSNGEVAESYFINSFKKYPYFAEQEFDFVEGNVNKYSKKMNLKGEYDLLLCNGNAVVIIEIKYKVQKEHVEQLIHKIDSFKLLFPHYNNYTIYLGLAGFHINVTAEKEALKQGVAIIKQVGKNMVINDAHLKLF